MVTLDKDRTKVTYVLNGVTKTKIYPHSDFESARINTKGMVLKVEHPVKRKPRVKPDPVDQSMTRHATIDSAVTLSQSVSEPTLKTTAEVGDNVVLEFAGEYYPSVVVAVEPQPVGVMIQVEQVEFMGAAGMFFYQDGYQGHRINSIKNKRDGSGLFCNLDVAEVERTQQYRKTVKRLCNTANDIGNNVNQLRSAMSPIHNTGSTAVSQPYSHKGVITEIDSLIEQLQALRSSMNAVPKPAAY